MALDGEVIKETFYIAKKPKVIPSPNIPETTLKSCCGACSFRVLANQQNFSDDLSNDRTGFLWWFPDSVSSASLKLQRFDSVSGDYRDLADLNSTTYGLNYPFAFFVNDSNEKFIGYQINWGKVLATNGEGSYKVKCTYSGLFGDGVYISDEYCMHEYSPARADNSVKIEYYLNGILGINEDDLGKRDYGNINWYNSLRLKGVFSYIRSEYQNDYTQYNNGNRPWIKDEQEPEYNLLLKPMCWNFHELMRTDVLQADEILITDYNSNNFKNFIQKSVQKTSEYKPNFFLKRNLQASITNLTFRQAINNLKKRRC